MPYENSLSIIIPAYNEARRLPATLSALRAYFSRPGAMTHEIIIIDDGSRDGTAEVARFYAAVSGSLVLNVALMYLFVSVMGIYDLLALVFTTLLTFGINYGLPRRWVFRPRLAANANI